MIRIASALATTLVITTSAALAEVQKTSNANLWAAHVGKGAMIEFGMDGKSPSARLYAANKDTIAAVILEPPDRSPIVVNHDGAPVQIKEITFDFHRNNRGIIFKDTTWPYLRIQIDGGGKRRFETVKRMELHDREKGWYWAWHRFEPYENKNERITAVAIVIKPNYSSTIPDYGDCVVSNLAVNGAKAKEWNLKTVEYDSNHIPDLIKHE